jgi:hypothetical protein
MALHPLYRTKKIEQLVKIQQAGKLHNHETWYSTHSVMHSVFCVVLLIANATIRSAQTMVHVPYPGFQRESAEHYTFKTPITVTSKEAYDNY